MYNFDTTQRLLEIFQEIKEAGWHESRRKGNTGIGKTFEDLLDKEEDNLAEPDLFDIEVKTHDEDSNSMITLFTKSPTNPRGANKYLRENYGALNEDGIRTLHQTVSAKQKTNSQLFDFDFSIEVDRSSRRVNICVFNKLGELIDNHIFWSFEDLQKQLEKKLKKIALVSGNKKEESGKVYYKYNQVQLVTGLNIDNLILAIENGDLKIDIRIGVYRTGSKMGQTHDHGTGFRISDSNLLKYADVVAI